jgi:hypothetical protein
MVKPPPNMGMNAIFNDIKNKNFKLSKMMKDNDANNDTRLSKVLKFVDTSKKVPTLDDIQNALKKLRKINYSDANTNNRKM